MRTFLVAIAVGLAIATAAQTTTTNNESNCVPLDSVGVVLVDSASDAELYSRASRWFAVAFKDSKEVVQLSDENSKTVLGKGTAKYHEKYVDGGWFKYTVEITCKDGRYRYSINTIVHDNPHVTTVYSGGVSGSSEARDFGMFYDCDLCCDLHRNWAEEHKKNTSGVAKRKAECKKEIRPKVDAMISGLVASIIKAMAEPFGDW